MDRAFILLQLVRACVSLSPFLEQWGHDVDFTKVKVLDTIKQIEFLDKVKRDQVGRVDQSLPVTLVTTKGQEADAGAKLSLLEAALTSSKPNYLQNGYLPRIFIAPSDVGPPPGYVKIDLIPQADAASLPRDSLPQTFLTPNANNLSPGLVRLDLPHSVSHLTRDIPVVVPNGQLAPKAPFNKYVLDTIKQIEFFDKVKRDQVGRVDQTLPMTLVTTKGQEADAGSKLSLLEAALTSSKPNYLQNGYLPRIFIAPSDVGPPPGYVKIDLIPQADAASLPRDSLPQTFLTPNANNLSPGLVRLDLPHSVSHLSRDIPVLRPDE